MHTSMPHTRSRRLARWLAAPVIAAAALMGATVFTAGPASAHTESYFDSDGVFHLTVDYGDGVHRDLSSDGGDSGFYYYSDNRP